MNNSIKSIIGLLLFAILITSPILSKSALASDYKECFDSFGAIKFFSSASGSYEKNILYTFKDNEVAQYYLLIGQHENKKDINGTINSSWNLLERMGKDSWCLIASGSEIEYLYSLHNIEGVKARYGLPGSGYQRCNTIGDNTNKSDLILNSMSVRIWANKELGNSFIQHFEFEINNSGFTFLNSLDPVKGKLPWILISTKNTKSDGISCYRGRGNDLKINKEIHQYTDQELKQIETLWE